MLRSDNSRLISLLGMPKCRALISLVWLVLLHGVANAAPDLEAKLAKDSAWTGEGVTLVITLYSPGPFSGTAAFDFPELPLTTFVQVGSPVVGSKTVDGESLLTQRHEFVVYTQRSGEIVIPPFQVRFAGKKSFVGEPEPVLASTPELRFQSRRPPVAESLGVVVAVTEMSGRQAWLPDDSTELQAGDVVQRTITREAPRTTSMMFPPASNAAPDGVRVYESNPVVEDTTTRGVTSARRVETIKYQFETAGTFELPTLEFSWWDIENSELKQVVLEGKTFEVAGALPQLNEELGSESPAPRFPLWFVVPASFVIGIGWITISSAYRRRQGHFTTAEARAAKRIREACHANDAAGAYAASLDWKRAIMAHHEGRNLQARLASSDGRKLQAEWTTLSAMLYGSTGEPSVWNGSKFYELFARVRASGARSQGRVDAELPALNPR